MYNLCILIRLLPLLPCCAIHPSSAARILNSTPNLDWKDEDPGDTIWIFIGLRMLDYLPKEPRGLATLVAIASIVCGLSWFTIYQAYQRLSAYDWRFKEDGTEFSESDYFRLCDDCQYGTLILPPTFVVYKRRTANKQFSKYLIDNM